MDYHDLNEEAVSHLIERFFEGETSLEQEALLRRFFTQEEVPSKWAYLVPLFTYESAERTPFLGYASPEAGKVPIKRRFLLRYRWALTAGIAALLVAGLLLSKPKAQGFTMSLNGKQSNNKELAMTKTDEALQKIAKLSAMTAEKMTSLKKFEGIEIK